MTDTYTFTTLQNVPKVTQISRAATARRRRQPNFTYDSNGYQNSVTDWNGNQTTYANNSHGQPTTINEAVGSSAARTTTIAYDPTFVHLPDSIIDAGSHDELYLRWQRQRADQDTHRHHFTEPALFHERPDTDMDVHMEQFPAGIGQDA